MSSSWDVSVIKNARNTETTFNKITNNYNNNIMQHKVHSLLRTISYDTESTSSYTLKTINIRNSTIPTNDKINKYGSTEGRKCIKKNINRYSKSREIILPKI